MNGRKCSIKLSGAKSLGFRRHRRRRDRRGLRARRGGARLFGLLLEQSDFGKGTSSRSTKLVHGGVAISRKGNVRLVREALKERRILQKTPRISLKLSRSSFRFYISDNFFYGSGLKITICFRAKSGFGKSLVFRQAKRSKNFRIVNPKNLRGGIVYFDGNSTTRGFNQSRANGGRTRRGSFELRACVFELMKDARGKTTASIIKTQNRAKFFEARAKAVINATGAFCDAVRGYRVKMRKKIIARVRAFIWFSTKIYRQRKRFDDSENVGQQSSFRRSVARKNSSRHDRHAD
jgi:glycerol-3-phosphate dehydrogenase